MEFRLPKIKGWIDENNPGDPLIPFSVALEERLAQLPDDDARAEEEKAIGAQSNLGKITTAGYASLNVRNFSFILRDFLGVIVCLTTCFPHNLRLLIN